jgi:hypothetical protein
MDKEQRLAWATEYVKKVCTNLSLPVPKVVERETTLIGMQLNVHLTDTEIHSMTSVTKLPWPELRLSSTALSEYDDEQLRFQLVFALIVNRNANIQERWISWACMVLAVPLVAGIFFKLIWLTVLSIIIAIVAIALFSWRQSFSQRLKSLLSTVQYTREPNSLFRFLEDPGPPPPLWVPDFFRRKDQQTNRRDVEYFRSILAAEGILGDSRECER